MYSLTGPVWGGRVAAQPQEVINTRWNLRGPSSAVCVKSLSQGVGRLLPSKPVPPKVSLGSLPVLCSSWVSGTDLQPQMLLPTRGHCGGVLPHPRSQGPRTEVISLMESTQADNLSSRFHSLLWGFLPGLLMTPKQEAQGQGLSAQSVALRSEFPPSKSPKR